jgi:hypothetical protein
MILKEHPLNAPIELKGFWWLPYSKEETDPVPGTLTLSPNEGLRLQLQGGLDAKINRKYVKPLPLIHGNCTDQYVTLEDSYPIHTSYAPTSDMEAQESIIVSSRAYLGALFDSKEEVLFDRIAVQIHNLGDWLWNTDAIDVKRILSRRTHIVRITQPKSFMYKLEEDQSIGFSYSAEGPHWDISQGSVKAKITPHLLFESPSPKTLGELLQEVRHFQNLLIMMIGVPCPVISVEARRYDENPPADALESYSRRVVVIYKSRQAQSLSATIHPTRMILRFSDVSEDLEDWLRTWYALDENIRVIQDLYFNTRTHDEMLIENRFMHLIQALESYHRLRFDSSVMNKRDYSCKVRKLLRHADGDEFKRLARHALNFGNRKSLFERLVELSDNYGRVLTGNLGANRDQFLRRVTNTRHYRTHFDPRSKRDILNANEMLHAYRLLRIMMEVCFFIEIGMDTNDAQELMSSKAKYFI